MFDEFISAVGGGEALKHAIGGALGAGGAATLLQPKVHLGLMVGLTSWCPNSRVHRAFLEAFSIAQGKELPPPPPSKTTKKKGKKQGKRGRR